MSRNRLIGAVAFSVAFIFLASPVSAGFRTTTWCCTAGDGNTWSDTTTAPITAAEFGYCYYPSSGVGRDVEGVQLMRQKAWYQPDENRGSHTFDCNRLGPNSSNYDYFSWGTQVAGTYYLRFTHSGNAAVDDIMIWW